MLLRGAISLWQNILLTMIYWVMVKTFKQTKRWKDFRVLEGEERERERKRERERESESVLGQF